MPVLDELVSYLVANGVGTAGGTANGAILEAFMPDAPDACVVLYEYSGSAGTYSFGPGAALVERPRIHVEVRDTSYPNAKAKMSQVHNLLDAVTELVLSGVKYHRIQALQAPFGLGTDKQGKRYLMACNYEATKDVS